MASLVYERKNCRGERRSISCTLVLQREPACMLAAKVSFTSVQYI